MNQRRCIRCGCAGDLPTYCAANTGLPMLIVVFGARPDGAPGLCCDECRTALGAKMRRVRPNPWSEREPRWITKRARLDHWRRMMTRQQQEQSEDVGHEQVGVT
jgi:hypothetical protein